MSSNVDIYTHTGGLFIGIVSGLAMTKELDEFVMPIARRPGKREKILQLIFRVVLVLAFVISLVLFMTLKEPERIV